MRWLIFSSWLAFASAFAQDGGSLAGKLVGADDGQPIPFATIRLKNKMIGVISNAEGDFVIPRRLQEEGDTLLISCIGYTTMHVPFTQFGTGVSVFAMKPAVVRLAPVIITADNKKRRKREGLTAYRLVKEAIKRIPENFPNERYSYVAYYRDYQTRKGEYLNLNEAIVEVRDGGFQTDDQLNTRISLLQYKRNTDFPRDSVAEAPYDNNPMAFYKDKNKYIPNAILSPMGGNELRILRLHDAIRNYSVRTYSYVNIFNTDFLENHSFKMEDAVYLDSVTLHCISFKSNYAASGPRNFAKGKIYIDVRDLAIHKLEYSTFNKTMQEVQLMYEIQVEYARLGRFMYLNYISFNNYFKTHNEREFRVIDIIYDRSRNAMQLRFNSEPESSSALNEQNYKLTLRDHSIMVTRVERSADVKTDVYVYLDEAVRAKLEPVLRDSPSDLHFDVKNVRDIANRELDKVTNTTLYQFRELFVQQLILHPSSSSNFASINPNKPLSTNTTVRAPDAYSRYWMNPPLRGKKEK